MQNWVIGKTGQLGRAMLKQSPGLLGVDRERLNLSDNPEAITQTLTDIMASRGRPEVIYLTAAYTNVDGAEQHPDTAERINAQSPAIIAQWCEARDVALVYISTDYVFDGKADRPYRAGDKATPLSVYGRTKLAGEKAVLRAQCAGAIIRTSWLYDAVGPNFFTAMIDQDRRGNPLRVVDDQWGRPTFAGDLAYAVIKAGAVLATSKALTKIYHATGSGDPVSWAGFARAILPAAKITPVSSDSFVRPAARPAYSVLDNSDFEAAFNLSLPDWRSGLDLALKDAAHLTAPPVD